MAGKQSTFALNRFSFGLKGYKAQIQIFLERVLYHGQYQIKSVLKAALCLGLKS